MTPSQKQGLYAGLGLLGTILVAWYFSRRQIATRAGNASAADTSDTGAGDMYNFNIPPLQIPPLSVVIPPTIPGAPSTGSGTGGGSCCIPCGSTAMQSGTDALSKAIQSSSVWNAVATNTPTPPKTQVTTSKLPYEPLVLTDPNNPDLAMKNPALYDMDPIYAKVWDSNYQRIYSNKTKSQACGDCVEGPITGGGGWSGSSNTGDFMPNNKNCIPACLPTVSDMLQAVQQDLLLYGDDPNANAVKPISIH